MKWGRKTPSPPSFGSSVITRVFPGSWFSKFKQTGGTGSGKKQQRGKLDFSTVNASLPGCRQARFYSLADDAYWTLSFRKDRGGGGGGGGGEGRRRNNRQAKINPLCNYSDDEFIVAVSGLRETQLSSRELEAISEIDTNEMKQERCSNNILREKKHDQLKKESMNVRRSRKLRGRVGRKKRAEFGTGLAEGEQESFPTELQKTDKVKEESEDSAASNSTSTTTSERVSTLKCQNLEDMKIEEFKVKTEEFQKESAYIRRRFCSRKVKQNPKKARGSRSKCRIQAPEGMKLKEREDEVAESSTIYNSFAVVKSSFNPQQDFRDSMVEMIEEKGIRRHEELRELLACYLTLNCDGHHDLIINVFQQVWFELRCFEE